jgi:hypothetical protein
MIIYISRNYFLAFILFFWVSASQAEQVKLSCKFDGGADLLPITIDLQTKKVYWTIYTGIRVVGDNEKFLTIKSPDNEKSIGGMYMVIDRFNGEFVQTVVKLNSAGKLYGTSAKGICNRKIF